MQAYGGAIADLDDDASAFSQRQARFEYVAAAKWSDPDEDATLIQTARRVAAKLDPFASGAYVNALSDEGAGGVRRAYSAANRARLTKIKDRYDPQNVFTATTTSRPAIAPFAELVRDASGHEATDPRRVACVVRDLAGRDDAPVRLLLGTDAVPVAQQTAEELAASDEAWREVSLSVSDGRK